MYQKRMQRAAVVLLMAALLLTAPLQAAGWTNREAPGFLETAWSWLVERIFGGNPAEPSLRPATEAGEAPIPPGGKTTPTGTKGDDGGAIDPNG